MFGKVTNWFRRKLNYPTPTTYDNLNNNWDEINVKDFESIDGFKNILLSFFVITNFIKSNSK